MTSESGLFPLSSLLISRQAADAQPFKLLAKGYKVGGSVVIRTKARTHTHPATATYVTMYRVIILLTLHNVQYVVAV
jgi:hypothetical protein